MSAPVSATPRRCDVEAPGRPRAVSPRELAARRAERADAADARLRDLLSATTAAPVGAALVAVGGYGRRELSPFSDLDVVLVHADDLDPGPLAERIWYPLWDDGVVLDHAVRTVEQMRAAAAADPRTALGLLDARHVAGDAALTLQVRSVLLADWRSDARRRLPELIADGRRRSERAGDVAHIAVPDIKESHGGLRDAVVLRGLVASWLVDVPHAEVERCRTGLLAVRDVLHQVAGRGGDRLLPELVPQVADLLGVADVDREVRELGRRIAYLSRLTWRRAEDAVAASPRAGRGRRPDLLTLAPGVARHGGEVVLDGQVRPARDPMLGLRASAAAAERDLVLAPASAVRLAVESAPLPEPWPAEARRLLVRLLGAGAGLRGVWDALDQAGALAWLPEWTAVTLRRSSSPVHRFTVDRHLVETCVETSWLVHRVRRPDLLLVAALLHDIGKDGRSDDHSEHGAALARRIAWRWGFAPEDQETVARLVRLHLLLSETATRRDLDDPATARGVADAVGTVETLELLAALTEADARATGPAAWTSWRARLVGRLVTRTRAVLEPAEARLETVSYHWPEGKWGLPPVRVHPAGTPVVETVPHPDGTVVQVGAPDRLGLLADVAAALALDGLDILSARAATEDGTGWSRWLVANRELDERRIRERLLRVLDGSIIPDSRLRRPAGDGPAPDVSVLVDASDTATVLEVRDRDWPGLVSTVCSVLSWSGAHVRSAHLQSIGAQAVDVFYMCDRNGRPWSPQHAASIAAQVSKALQR